MPGDQAEVEKKKTFFWPLNLLPGLTHIYLLENVVLLPGSLSATKGYTGSLGPPTPADDQACRRPGEQG